MNLNDKFVRMYRVCRTTSSIDDDLKPLKKMNNLIAKFQKTAKDVYKFEVINILKYNKNIFSVNTEFLSLIKNNFIEPQNQPIFEQICEVI